mmetsp:Transcript_55675/g.129644  ORF Transcript_55675/g.129644 Transcript_55675/m.129644 type:complete len:265 (-) Transcript_55675:320-1114(-)
MHTAAAAPPKPWERGGRRLGTSGVAQPSPVSTPTAGPSTTVTAAPRTVAVSNTSVQAVGTTTSSSSRNSALSPAATSFAYSPSMYGGSMYGRSMYGGYGSSMYGGYGSSMYGGYGSSMYGGSMYGRGYGSSMCGRQEDSEFFVPKRNDQTTASTGRFAELGELNTNFLDSLHACGNSLCTLVQRLIGGLARLHAAVSAGTVAPDRARQAAALAVAAFAVCVAGAARGAVRRRQRRLMWEEVFVHALAPLPAGLGTRAGVPRASL